MTFAKKYDVVALSAVCVDIQVHADDKVLEEHGLQKGFTNVVSPETLKKIMSDTTGHYKSAGSPGANVTAGIALRGGASALIGKIANDEHGKFFSKRMLSLGVSYIPLLSSLKSTPTTCLVAVTTPDKERSFAFINGASYELRAEDVDHSLVSQAKITYLDSYLWLSESGRETIHHAAEQAKKAGGKVAISLNDANIVERNQVAFHKLALSHGDILVGDQKEFSKLLGTQTMEETVKALQEIGCTAAITAGAKGAYVVHGGNFSHVSAHKVEKIVDTNGAGDQFAAGFLYGLAQGKTPVEAAHQGASWAAEIIQHRGAEPILNKKPAPKPPKTLRFG